MDTKYEKPSRRANYTGRKFGRLYVEQCLVLSNGNNKQGEYLCTCDCGTKDLKLSGYNLQRQDSCGCLRHEHRLRNALIRRKPSVTTINNCYCIHVCATNRDGRKPLAKEQWLNIVIQPCYYCGEIDIRNIASTDHYKRRAGVTLTEDLIKQYEVKINGVDRIDSTKGYELDNCLPCCTTCNTMKMANTQEEFFRKVQLVNINNAYRDCSLESFLCN